MLRYVGLALLFLVVYMLVLRPVKKQALAAFRELPGRIRNLATVPAGEASANGQLVAGESEGGEKRAGQLKRLLTDKVKAEPESASRLVQGWVQQGAKK
jgi:flagellar M-ring protein FliF